MKSKLLIAVLKPMTVLAFVGLLMVGAPSLASARGDASCYHRPGWGYEHPNRYNEWSRLHCGDGYAYSGRYYGYGEPHHYWWHRHHWHHHDWDHDRDHDRDDYR